MLGLVERLLAGPEARFHPKQDPPDSWGALGGYQTDAGVTITPDTAIALTAVFACIRILAETLAMLPLQFYQKQERGRRPAPEFYLDQLLSESPNREMTSFEFRETLMGHLGGWGNAFAEIEWNGAGRVQALWPLPPNRVQLYRNDKGELIYEVRLTKPDKQGRMKHELKAFQVWHLRGLGANGLVGYSPIAIFRQSLGLTKALEKFGSKFFNNGAAPGVVLTHPGTLDAEVHKRLKTSWDESHRGLDESHRVAILEEGMSIVKIGIPPEDAQFLATRKFQLSEIARMYRMQPHKIGDLEHATFSNIEHMAIEHVVDTMLPWLVRWEASSKRSLMLPSERQAGFYPKFNANGLLRGDTVSRFQAYAQARQWGWLSANDVRELEDLNPIEGGDIYMMPLNMVPVGEVGGSQGNKVGATDPSETPENIQSDKGLNGAQIKAAIDILTGVVDGTVADSVAVELLVSLGIDPDKAKKMVEDTIAADLAVPETKNVRSTRFAERLDVRANNAAQMRHRLQGRYQGLFEDSIARVMRRERNDVLAQARKDLRGKRNLSDFQAWLEKFYRDHEAFVYEQLLPLFSSYGDAIQDAVNDELGQTDDPDFEGFLRSYAGSFARRYSQKQLQDLLAFLDQAGGKENFDELFQALEVEFDSWLSERPADYALDEAVRGNNAIAKHLYVLGGVLTIRWVRVGESCPYCDHLDGAEIEIHAWFLEPGDFQPEGADKPLTVTRKLGHPPAHRGCDCISVAGSVG